jgi:hypothetical protein
MNTQKQRILQALREHPDGLPVWMLIMPRPHGGLGVAQYNARIYELRRQGYGIESKNNKFILTYEPQSYEVEQTGQYKFI